MDKNNKQWEKLVAMPEEYEQDSSLADRAMAEIQGRQPQTRKNWWQLHWKKVTACAASLVLALGIGIPVYKKISTPSTPPIVYYAADDLEYETVSDVEAFVSDKKLSIGFFNVPNVQTRSGTIKATDKVALLYQKLVYMSPAGFDQIELNVVLEKNLKLDLYEQYFEMQEKTTVNGVVVSYKATSVKNDSQQVLAKFTHENAEYYLDIVTGSEPTECINTYVNILIG